jgi:hypothetical protein
MTRAKTDRELLELAAKAEGRQLKYMTVTNAAGERVDRFIAYWNPLTDDGDALRLAVKLQIGVKQYGDHVVAWFGGGFIGTGRIQYDGDPCAATRRAIVRAAAAIGEAMS